MTKAQVMAAEPDQPSEVRETNTETVLQYDSVRLDAQSGRLLYFFTQDRLRRARYVFNAAHEDLNSFIGDFKAIEPVLTEKYGRPEYSRALWDSPAYQYESKSYLDSDRATPAEIFPSDKFVGMEVALGHLKLYTQWKSGRTRILHALTGENSRVTHQIEYIPVE
jgi:hypothetical protein